MSNLLNTTAGQSMNLFMTLISNLRIKVNVVGYISDAPICVLEDKDIETKKKIVTCP